ncbi:unnamed protein product, partial [Ectocarpus sp. 8 AP-2014]
QQVACAVGGGKTPEQCFNRWHDEYLRRVALEQQQQQQYTGVVQQGHHRPSGRGAASSDSGSGGGSSSSSIASSSANQHVAMSLQQQQQQQRAQAAGQGYPVYWRSSYNGPPPAIQSNTSGWPVPVEIDSNYGQGGMGAKCRGAGGMVAGPEGGGGHDALRNLALLATAAAKSEEDGGGVKRENDGTFGGV